MYGRSDYRSSRRRIVRRPNNSMEPPPLRFAKHPERAGDLRPIPASRVFGFGAILALSWPGGSPTGCSATLEAVRRPTEGSSMLRLEDPTKRRKRPRTVFNILFLFVPIVLLSPLFQSCGLLAPSRTAPPGPRLPPAWTPTANAVPPTALPTPARTPKPSPTAPSSYEDRLHEARPDIERAMGLMKGMDYAAAMPLWDSILARVPEYGDGYLQRLICRRRSQSAVSPGQYLALISAIIEDADASIALDPTANGDNYFYRSITYQELGREQIYRVDQDANLEIAFENLRVANAIGPRTDYSLRMESFVLYALGRCDEGLARANELMAQSDLTQVPVYAGLHSALASGYLCKGRLDQALKEMDTTLAAEYSAGRMFTRAVILYNLGRPTDALNQLEEVYQLEPSGNGYRRYLEALIHFDMGDSTP